MTTTAQNQSQAQSGSTAVTPLLVALDIDGTLLDADMVIPLVTTGAVATTLAAGHHIVLASGRSLVGILPVARALGISTGWLVASNGAIIVRLDPDTPDGYIVEHALTFDVEPAARLVHDVLPHAEIAVEELGWGYRTITPVPDDMINGRQRVVPLNGLWSQPAPRAFLRGNRVLDLLEPLRALGITATPAGPQWIDLTPAGLSKATALEYVRQQAGVAASDTMAVGDGHNDITMLQWAARGVAMAHAPEELIEIADEITGTIAEHGVVDILRSISTPATIRGALATQAASTAPPLGNHS